MFVEDRIMATRTYFLQDFDEVVCNLILPPTAVPDREHADPRYSLVVQIGVGAAVSTCWVVPGHENGEDVLDLLDRASAGILHDLLGTSTAEDEDPDHHPSYFWSALVADEAKTRRPPWDRHLAILSTRGPITIQNYIDWATSSTAVPRPDSTLR